MYGYDYRPPTEPDPERRVYFAGGLALKTISCFMHTTKFRPNRDFDPDLGFTMIQPIIVPWQYRDDEEAQTNIALSLVKMSLVDMTTAIIESGGTPRNFALANFDIHDDAEQQVGLQSALLWQGELQHPPVDVSNGMKSFVNGEMETREQRLRMFWDDEEMEGR